MISHLYYLIFSIEQKMFFFCVCVCLLPNAILEKLSLKDLVVFFFFFVNQWQETTWVCLSKN